MSKTYTNEEIHDILHTLFLEKRKSSELEEQLKDISSENCSLKQMQQSLSSQLNQAATLTQKEIQKYEKYQSELAQAKTSQQETEEELNALRHQLVQLKAACELTRKESENYKTEVETSKQKEEQLERAIQFLRKRVEESHLENQSVADELSSSQKNIELLNQDISTLKLAFEKAQEKLHEKEHFVESLQKTNDEQTSTHGNLADQLNAYKSSHEHLECSLHALNTEKQALEACLKEAQNALTASHREAEMARQMMLKSVQEVKHEIISQENGFLKKIQEMEIKHAQEIQNAFESVQKQEILLAEKDSVLKEKDHYATQLMQIEKSLREEIDLLFGHKQELEISHQQLEKDLENQCKQTKELLLKLDEEQQKVAIFSEQSKQKGSENEELHQQVHQLNLTKLQLQEGVTTLTMKLEEEEGRFKLAQQHLAKKVRETTILTEKCDEQQNQILELQNHINQSRLKISELQTSLEIESQHQKRLQEQLAENLKLAEIQRASWEEKYLKIYEKWQESESQIRSFKLLEERYQHLQQVFANAGNVLSSPLSFVQAAATVKSSSFEIGSHELPSATATQIQAPLFETKMKPSPFKETLFD